jgi:hypothetical protein
MENETNYLQGLKDEIANMTQYEQIVSRSVLILGEAICLILQRHDYQVLKELKSMVDEVFVQAQEAVRDDFKNVQ